MNRDEDSKGEPGHGGSQDETQNGSQGGRLGVRDLAAFQFGSRRAIERIAATPAALAVGLLLVLSASIARNYDGSYLVREWDVLLHGVVVSIGNSFALYCLFAFAARKAGESSMPFWRGYRAFLTLFWFTSPTAWFYAVPYEHFLAPLDAVYANVITLGFVSVWRVALITRVCCVLWGARVRDALSIVLGFCGAVLLIAVLASPWPVVDFMSGVRSISEAEAAMNGINLLVRVIVIMLSPVYLIIGLVGLKMFKNSWSLAPWRMRGLSAGVYLAMVGVVAACGVGLSLMQPSQARRHHAESLLKNGEVEEGLAYMSRYTRRDFPPAWEPKLVSDLGKDGPRMSAVRAAIEQETLAEWLKPICVDASWREYLRQDTLFMWNHPGPSLMPADISEQVQWNENYTARDRFESDGGDAVSVFRLHLRHDTRMSEADREVLRVWISAIEAERAEADAPKTEPRE